MTPPVSQRRPSLAVAAVIACLCAPARADEVRTKDGRVLVGKTTIAGRTLTLDTVDGPVSLSLDEVERIRDDAELRAELARLADRGDGTSPFRQLELARTARSFGLETEMWQHLDACLGHANDDSRTRERAERFMAGLEPFLLSPRQRRAGVDVRARELLFQVRPLQKYNAVRTAAVVAVLAHLEGADDALRQRARDAGSIAQREAALRAIARRAEQGNDRFLYRTAILDPSAEIRAAAMALTVDAGRAREAIHYLAPGLVAGTPMVRIRTADAYANLGDASAVPVLVAAAASLPGGSTRGHVAFLEQEAYVRDFDVEVAQAAFIADPKIGVLQAGTVLDVTVHGVVTERIEVVDAYRRAMRRLVGSDPGPRTARWNEWLASLGLPGGKEANFAVASRKGAPGVRGGLIGLPPAVSTNPCDPPALDPAGLVTRPVGQVKGVPVPTAPSPQPAAPPAVQRGVPAPIAPPVPFGRR
jgi:hypothetical protein